MAAVQALTAQGLGVSTSSPHTTFREVCKISAGSFTPGAKYLILASAFVSAASSANEALMRLLHNATPFTDGALASELTNGIQKANYGWMYVYTQPGTPEDITLEVANASTSQTTVEWGRIIALNLDDIGTQGVDYFWNEVTSDYATTSSFVDQAAVTFTPNGTDDYWIIANGMISGVQTGSNHRMRLNDSSGGAQVTIDVEGEDNANEVRGYLLMSGMVAPSATPRTVSAQFNHESAAHTVLSSRVFAMPFNKFAQHIIQKAAGQITPASNPSWSNLVTASPTPNATGDWLVWGYSGTDIETIGEALFIRLQINATGAGLASNPNYGDSAPGADGWDNTDILPANLFTLVTLNSGAARQINFDAQLGALSIDPRIVEVTLIAFSLELAGSGGGGIPLMPILLSQTRLLRWQPGRMH